MNNGIYRLQLRNYVRSGDVSIVGSRQLEKLLRGQINTKVIQENYDDVLRLAHSIREGTVSASLIMGKLGSYARQNSLATASVKWDESRKISLLWITFQVKHYGGRSIGG
jgi:hypothetical protein